MRKSFIILILVAIQSNSSAQNLVLNGGFEIVTDCTPTVDVLNCPPWFRPTTGTPDNFHQCFQWNMGGVPSNGFGYQPAHSGMGYAGMIVLAHSGGREYIEGKLSAPLLPGRIYCVEFYTSITELSSYGIDAIGIHFSNDSITDYNGYFPQLFAYSAHAGNPVGNIITDTLGWTLVSDTFIAQGGEQFITIGNFCSNANTNTIEINYSNGASYMYIDDVSVRQCGMVSGGITPEYNSYIPNAFSPNGDGNNDLLFVRGKNITELTFTVYNRWGEKVFETQNINEGWDGSYRGVQLENAVFVYHATLIYADGKTETKSGNVSLVK
jgi:gliding motility-associated-like protein